MTTYILYFINKGQICAFQISFRLKTKKPKDEDKPQDEDNETNEDNITGQSKSDVENISSTETDLGRTLPKQPSLSEYPSTMYGKKQRRFQKAWYTGRPWLEYSVQLDACFCYCCRKYTKENDPDADSCFTKTGFRNWKTALADGRGLLKHATSKIHMNAVQTWAEHSVRNERNLTIENQLSSSQMDNNRYYIKSIAEVVQFLAVNELSFRGDIEVHGDESRSAWR